MPDPDLTTRAAYDRIAPQFSRTNAVMPPELVESAGRLLDQMPPGARILDLGCGAGRDLAWLQAYAQNMHLFGADLSTGMLAEAQQITSAALCQMDMRELGIASASLDAIWCMAALLHLPKHLAPTALAEMARVLKPGGIFHLSVQGGEGEGVERGAYGDPTVERYFARYSQTEIDHLLIEAGFDLLLHGENISHRRWLWFEARKYR